MKTLSLSILLLALVGLIPARSAIQEPSLIPTAEQLAQAVPLPGDATGAILMDVPVRTWDGGCVPTCVGMILSYYEIEFPITTEHYLTHYFLPYDEWGCILPDCSVDPEFQNIEPTCLAEILHTSFSCDGLPSGYTQWTALTEYLPQYFDVSIGTFGWNHWDLIVREIQDGRPMFAQVNLSAENVGGGHMVVLVGYATDSLGNRYYGCLNTWEPEVRWYPFAGAEVETQWGLAWIYTLHHGFNLRTLHYLEELLKSWWWKKEWPIGNSLAEYNDLEKLIKEYRSRLGMGNEG